VRIRILNGWGEEIDMFIKSIRVREKGVWRTVKKIKNIQNCDAVEIKKMLTLAELKKHYPTAYETLTQ